MRILLSLFVVYSHYMTSISHLTSIHFLIRHLQKTIGGWRAVSSEGGDIESGEHDVVWMDGMEVLTIEVRMRCCILWYEQNL